MMATIGLLYTVAACGVMLVFERPAEPRSDAAASAWKLPEMERDHCPGTDQCNMIAPVQLPPWSIPETWFLHVSAKRQVYGLAHRVQVKAARFVSLKNLWANLR